MIQGELAMSRTVRIFLGLYLILVTALATTVVVSASETGQNSCNAQASDAIATVPEEVARQAESDSSQAASDADYANQTDGQVATVPTPSGGHEDGYWVGYPDTSASSSDGYANLPDSSKNVTASNSNDGYANLPDSSKNVTASEPERTALDDRPGDIPVIAAEAVELPISITAPQAYAFSFVSFAPDCSEIMPMPPVTCTGCAEIAF